VHFHHRHDVDGCVDAHEDWPPLAGVLLATLDRLESRMSNQQTSIDAAVTVIGDLVAEVQNLKGQISPAVDTSALDAAVAAAQAVITPAVPVADAPADTAVSDVPPVEAPASPVEDLPVEAPVEAPAAVDPGPIDITVPAT
jgi:hypothetical protein